jgi:hypothetical protein
MSWARIDDGFDDHPKVVALLDEDDTPSAAAAVALWTLCLTWAHRNTRRRGKMPGLLPAGLPRRFLGGLGKDGAQLLVKHGLWEAQDDGGWRIHDFGDYLPTEETREARSAAGKRGAASRWAAKHAEDAAKSKQTDGNLPSGSHNEASKPVANDGSRAPARRAISKEIAPVPVPVPEELFPPTAGAGAHTEDSEAGAGQVVAAYYRGAKDGKHPRPAATLGARIGKQAKQMLSEGTSLDALVEAAFDTGKAGYQDLAVQIQRNSAARQRRPAADAPYRNPTDANAYDDYEKGPKR